MSTLLARSEKVLELYLERPWHAACRARASLGALRIQRLEGSRSPESVLCIFYRIATSGLDRRTSLADGVGVGRRRVRVGWCIGLHGLTVSDGRGGLNDDARETARCL